jgi:hypothetical protein
MFNKPVNRSRAFLALEIGFVALLCWVAVSSVIWPGSRAEAQDPRSGLSGQKEHRKGERWIPEEGPVPDEARIEVIAGLGTTVSCTTFDFAGGATQGFTTVPVFGTPLVLWHAANSVCRAFLTGHTTPYTFYYGQDATCNYNTGARNASNLISPSISLTGNFAPFSVSFNYLLFVEGGGFDSTFVDLSTDNGATWTQFLSKANLINDNQWHNVVANVTSLVGAATSVRLRFRFDSVDNIANSTTGWHVDDISVCGEKFNNCVQDDTTGDFIRFNSVTGAYVSQQCSTGFTTDGVGTVTTNGNTTTLTHFTTGKFNTVSVNNSTNTGTAAIRVRNGLSIVAYNIKDSNTLNNTCSCP